MKKIVLSFLFLIWFSVAFASADQGGYTISKYDVDMQVNTDGSMHVTENITANFSEARHGIYRDIPINSNGRQIEIENLTSNSDPILSNSIINDNYEIKMGDLNKTVIWDHIYTINYDVKNAIGHFSTRDELYRNMIGTKRNTTIKNISFKITLPKNTTFGSWESFVVYGSEWEKKVQWATIRQESPTTIIGWLMDGSLHSQEWLTIGLKFNPDYFSLPDNYQEDSNKASTNNPSFTVEAIINLFGKFIWNIIPFIIILSVILNKKRGTKWIRWSLFSTDWCARCSKKPITIYYKPPQNIEPIDAFRFRYGSENSKIFPIILYYWASKWRITIEQKVEKYFFGWFSSKTFHIIEKSWRPTGTSLLDDQLYQNFFGIYDVNLDDVAIDEDTYKKVNRITGVLSDRREESKLAKAGGFLWLSNILTPEGEDIFEQLRGYKEFLEKVERPVIEAELKNDPDYINKLLPWAVLFGLETTLLKKIEDLVAEYSRNWYHSETGSLLNIATFTTMNTYINSCSVAPRSSSWFGGWGGSSWWGWGGGWGGSF